jgi:hypothetical protein
MQLETREASSCKFPLSLIRKQSLARFDAFFVTVLVATAVMAFVAVQVADAVPYP